MRVPRPDRIRILRSRFAVGVALAAVTLMGAGCESASSASSTAPTAATAAANGSGDVDVLSAGSLQTLMKTVAPAFHKATGYSLVDTSGGSSSLAADIKNKVDVADVFVSASPEAGESLEGEANGSWVSWYARFASSPLVLGYYPKSRFAEELTAMPWYDVVTRPGFRLGRTNPTQDPGGVLAAEALDETAEAQHLPKLKALATESSDEYAENSEEADIQTGQLDAAFMYLADAISQGSPHVKLTGVHLAGEYTITVVKGAPHLAAAEAFIRFLLGAVGQSEMKADQFDVVSPAKVSGSGVPSALTSLFG